jgi:hypothetical protein
MERPGFDVAAVRQTFESSGITGLLPEADAAKLEAALTALDSRLGEVHQLQDPDISAETMRRWAGELVGIYDGFEFTGETIGSPVRFALAWSWWVTINRQAKAILCLYDAGLGVDAAPLMRSMIEYCLWLVVLARDEGPLLATIFRGSDAERDRMIKNAIGGLLEIPPEVAELVEATPPVTGEGSPIKSFNKVCQALGVTETIGVIWRGLSSLSHPTTNAAFFLTQLGADGVKITKTPAMPGIDQAELADQGPALAVECLLWAGFAIDRLMAEHPLLPMLQPVADEAHVHDLGEQSWTRTG